MPSSISIRQASVSEIDLLLKIWIEKVIYLKEKNIPMWDTGQFSLSSLKNKYINPAFYAAFLGEEIVGGFILIEKDHIYWPEKDDDALYLHKLVVKNGYGKKGYSHEMLEWTKAFGKKMRKSFIRLDFDDSRAYLKEMYLSHGFLPVERIINPDGRSLTKAEFIL